MEFIVRFCDLTRLHEAMVLARQRGYLVRDYFGDAFMFVVDAPTAEGLWSLPGICSVACNGKYGCRYFRALPWHMDQDPDFTIKRTVSYESTLAQMGIKPRSVPGVTVALIGSGVDESALTGRVPVEHVNFTDEPTDTLGHETAIARIIQGIAPAAKILDIHVLTKGEGKVSDVIRGLIEAKKRGVQIANLSLGSADAATPNEPVAHLIDQYAGDGLISVVAAGNSGPGPVEAPSGAQLGLIVGSVNSRGLVSYFSGRGPDATGRIRPDIVASGGDSDETILVSTVGTMRSMGGVRGTSFSAGYISAFLASNYDRIPEPKVFGAQSFLKLSARGTDWKNNEVGYGIPDGGRAAGAASLLRAMGPFVLRPIY